MTEKWEIFCDAAYYDMWCVRKVGDLIFGQGFHVMSKDEACVLCAQLAEKNVRIAELEGMTEFQTKRMEALEDLLVDIKSAKGCSCHLLAAPTEPTPVPSDPKESTK